MLAFSFFLSKQHNLTPSPINLLFNKGNEQSWLEYQESGVQEEVVGGGLRKLPGACAL